MNKKITLMIVIALFSYMTGCDVSNDKDEVQETQIDLINDQYTEAQSEIQEVLDGIFKSIQDKDADKLISYHAYGEKFTEFRDSEPRFNSQENEQYERGLVDAISGFDYELGDLKIAVYGEVAVVTFHADFRPTIGQDVVQIWESTTLVFVKTDQGWKITHEHHSPFNTEEISARPIETKDIVNESSQVNNCPSISFHNNDKYSKNTIVEEDYPFLKNLECMKKNNYLENRGWNLKLRNINPENPSHYELRAQGPKIDLHATYDKDGKLVESTFRKRDTRIPYAIRKFIISGEFEGWKMISNEMTVKDFNAYQTEYKVVLSDGTMEKVLHFKNHGNWIALLEN